MAKPIIAFFLGILSFLIYRFSEEFLSEYLPVAPFIPVAVVLTAYFFICQFLLSHGNPNAFRKDWPTMLALGFVPVIHAVWHIIGLGWGYRGGLVGTVGLVRLVGSVGGTLAGAVAASLAARRKVRRPLE